MTELHMTNKFFPRFIALKDSSSGSIRKNDKFQLLYDRFSNSYQVKLHMANSLNSLIQDSSTFLADPSNYTLDIPYAEDRIRQHLQQAELHQLAANELKTLINEHSDNQINNI